MQNLNEILSKPVLYEYLGAKTPVQQSKVDAKITKYINEIVAWWMTGKFYNVKDTDYYHFNIDKFRLEIDKITNFKTKKQEWFVSVVSKVCPTWETVQTGSNLTGKTSMIQLKFNLNTQQLIDLNLVDELIKDQFNGSVPSLDDTEQYEWCPIDMDSLGNYIVWNSTLAENTKNKEYQRQAMAVYTIANQYDGKLPQKIKESEFGRRYYEGISIQSVSKVVRAAMLGHHFQHDLNSAAYAIRLNLVFGILEQNGFTRQYMREVFKECVASTEMLEDKGARKHSIRYQIAKDVFGDKENFNEYKDYYVGVIKTAMTAIGFGAKVEQSGYYKNDVWHLPALEEVFSKQDPETGYRKVFTNELNKFKNNSYVKKLLKENDEFTKVLFEYFKPALKDKEFLKNGRGICKNKVIAYIFQHTERQIMDQVEQACLNTGIKVIGRVHDSIVTDKPINTEVKSVLQSFMNDYLLQVGGTLINMESEEFQAYTFNDQTMEREHKERIQLEEARSNNGIVPIKKKVKLPFIKREQTETYNEPQYVEGYNEEMENEYKLTMTVDEYKNHMRIMGISETRSVPGFIGELL